MIMYANIQILCNTVNMQRALSFHSLSQEAPDEVRTVPNAAFDGNGALTRKTLTNNPISPR